MNLLKQFLNKITKHALVTVQWDLFKAGESVNNKNRTKIHTEFLANIPYFEHLTSNNSESQEISTR